MIKFVLRAASTLGNSNGEQRALKEIQMASSEHFVNFPFAGICHLKEICFVPSNLIDT